MIVLIDSWAWVEYFKGSQKGNKVKEFVDNSHQIIISVINVAEVFRHMLSKMPRGEAEDALKYMLAVSFTVPVSLDIAMDSAIIKHEKKWGLGDSIILATAMRKKAIIVTGDNHFKNEKNVVFLG